jgi:DHHC palmitoyltransferase
VTNEVAGAKYVEDDRFEGISKDIKSLLKYRNKTIGALDAASWISTCSECVDLKPLRTRHCSVCNRCVFDLDHHSPWVNNCLGLENQRFYLLFLLYLFLGLGYNLVTIRAIWNHYIYKQNVQLMNFVFLTDQVLLVILGAANVFHWALAMTGIATVDVLCVSTIPISHR